MNLWHREQRSASSMSILYIRKARSPPLTRDDRLLTTLSQMDEFSRIDLAVADKWSPPFRKLVSYLTAPTRQIFLWSSGSLISTTLAKQQKPAV